MKDCCSSRESSRPPISSRYRWVCCKTCSFSSRNSAPSGRFDLGPDPIPGGRLLAQIRWVLQPLELRLGGIGNRGDQHLGSSSIGSTVAGGPGDCRSHLWPKDVVHPLVSGPLVR